ncbi:MAG: hypothetical protein ACREN2_03905 [Candidatus Dormibacteria bacterium]
MIKADSSIRAHVGRRIAIRIAGVAIATSGIALLGVGTMGGPLSTGHNKLVSTVADSEGCTSHTGDFPVSDDNSGCCTTKTGEDVAAAVAETEGDGTCSTSSSSSSSSAASSSAASSSAASSVASTATSGVQAATTPTVPKTGTDIEVGLGLGLIVAGAGLTLAETRRRRS